MIKIIISIDIIDIFFWNNIFLIIIYIIIIKINIQNLDLNQVIANDQFGDVLSNLSRQMLSDLKVVNVTCGNLLNNINEELPEQFKSYIKDCYQVKSEISAKITNNDELERKINILKQIQSQFLKPNNA